MPNYLKKQQILGFKKAENDDADEEAQRYHLGHQLEPRKGQKDSAEFGAELREAKEEYELSSEGYNDGDEWS